MFRLTVFFLLLTASIQSQETAETLLLLSEKAGPIPKLKSITEKKNFFPGIHSFLLPNKIRVVLKPNKEEETIQFRFVAPGGSWNFPPSTTNAAKYAGTFALQSGYSKIPPLKLNSLLFQYSLEFSPRTRPFHRHIDMSCLPENSDLSLALLHHFFLDITPTKEGMEPALKGIEDAMVHRSKNCESLFEDAYLLINSAGHPSMLPTTQEQVRSITLEEVQEVFTQSFTNPSEFTLIAVGPINLDEITQTILRYLGTIPIKENSLLLQNPPPKLSFPKGKLYRTIFCSKEAENLVRITFPVRFPLTEKNYSGFEIATQILELRLREAIHQKYGSTQGVDIQYHLPNYPFITTVWLTVQYRSSPKALKEITALCLKTMDAVRKEGATQPEITQIKLLFERLNNYWLKQDDYWIQMMSNNLFWGWSLQCIEHTCSEQQDFSQEVINKTLQELLNLTDYTVLNLE